MSQNGANTEVQPSGYAEDPLAYYTNVFARFLQLIFATFPKGSYHWSDDDNQTDLLITDQSPITQEAVEKIPHIVVMRGAANPSGLALNLFQGADAESGRRDFTDLVSSVMTLTAISREGREAQRLASICRTYIRAFRRDLYRGGNIHFIGNIAVGPESSPGSMVTGDKTGTAVQVIVPFFYQDFWSVEPVDKLLLKGIDLRVTSQAVAGIKQPSMNGSPLQVDKVFSLNSQIRVSRQTTPKPRK
jgi:hypothetical protein